MTKINLKFLSVILFAFILIGCSEKKTEEAYIEEAKTQLEAKKYDEALATYQAFVKEYPKSDKAVFAYQQIAGIQIDALKKPLDGIATYKVLAETYPDTKDAKQSLFMIAFIYDENLKDKQNAIQAYKDFLAKYPKDLDANDKMSESASTMLEVLESGKSIEEMIQQNIEKSGTQSASDTGKVNTTETDKKTVEKKSVETKKPEKTEEKSKE